MRYFVSLIRFFYLILLKMTEICILYTHIHNLSMEETLEIIDSTISKGEQLHHVVVNAGKIVAMQTDLQLRQSVNESDLINADGQAVVWASKILKKPLKERVAGIDLWLTLLRWLLKRNIKYFSLEQKKKWLKRL